MMVWKILSSFRMLEPMSDPLLSSRASLMMDPKSTEDPVLNSRSNSLPASPPSSESLKIEDFDGRAKDPVSGRDYLFNSSSGERRWV
ncbi:cadherin-related family member 4-like [Pleurodeles waltl]